jgi:hypothetical protein
MAIACRDRAWLAAPLSCVPRDGSVHPAGGRLNPLSGSSIVKMTFTALTLALALAAPAAPASEADERNTLSTQLIERWSIHVEEAYQQPGSQWSGEIAPLLEFVPIEDLRAAATAADFQAMNNALLGQAGGDTQAFGDADSDLLFVPVPPCRLLDTRVAGGPIAAGGTRSFDITAVSSYSPQGGDTSACGVGDKGLFAAAVINFTVVNPGLAGYLTAYPFGTTQPLAATVNYTAGDIRGNLATVKLDQSPTVYEITVYTFAQTHLVADIVGYFRNPSPPQLQCVNTAFNTRTLAAGTTDSVSAPLCPTGHIETSTRCQSSASDMSLLSIDQGNCTARNASNASVQLRAARTCCRVVIN